MITVILAVVYLGIAAIWYVMCSAEAHDSYRSAKLWSAGDSRREEALAEAERGRLAGSACSAVVTDRGTDDSEVDESVAPGTARPG